MTELPSAQNLITLLQKCRHTKDLTQAKQLYAFLHELNLHSHNLFGNCLIATLADCGSFCDAMVVFNCLSHRDQHSWNALICGCVQIGDHNSAFHLFERMWEDGYHLADSHTFVALLKTCTSLKDISRGLQVCAKIEKIELKGDSFLSCTLVTMYARFGWLAKAQEVFDQLQNRDVTSWTALIGAYAEHGLGEKALHCFEQMLLDGVALDAVTCICGLNICSHTRAIENGQEIHSIVIKRGWDGNVSVCNKLVDMYGNCGLLLEAHHVFNKMLHRDVVSWNTLISQFNDHGLGEEAFICYNHMQIAGVVQNAVTFVCIIKACGSIRDLQKGHTLHAEAALKGYDRELYVGGSLVDMYAKCGSLQEAELVFNQCSVKNEVSWTSLILGYAENGFYQKVLNCLECMRQDGVSIDSVTILCSLKCSINGESSGPGHQIHSAATQRGLETNLLIGSTLVDIYSKHGSLVKAVEVFDYLPVRNVVAWNALITGYAEYGSGDDTIECFKRMCIEGVTPDGVTFVCCLKACGNIGALEIGQAIHTEILIKGLERDPYMDSTLVYMYAKCGSMLEAEKIYNKLPAPDVASSAALLLGFAGCGMSEETFKCFKEIVLQFVLLDTITLACCLRACTLILASDKGREIHANVIKLGLETDIVLANELIDIYSKCGSVVEAENVFMRMPNKDIVTWNTILKGYGEEQEDEMAVQCFEDMQRWGVQPNAITFTCLLVACNHASLQYRGQKYFKMMVEDYKIKPTSEHCVCMVNLLAGSGCILEAERFIAAMQQPPPWEVSIALLSACKVYGESKAGVKCFGPISAT